MYEVMKGTVTAREAIQHTRRLRHHSGEHDPRRHRTGAAQRRQGNDAPGEAARRGERRCGSDYDYILIDCPPSLGLLTVNALTAADYLLIPTMAETFAASGITQLYDTYTFGQKIHQPGAQNRRRAAHAHRAHPGHKDHSGADRKDRGLHGRGCLPHDHPQQRDHQGSAGCAGERVRLRRGQGTDQGRARDRGEPEFREMTVWRSSGSLWRRRGSSNGKTQRRGNVQEYDRPQGRRQPRSRYRKPLPRRLRRRRKASTVQVTVRLRPEQHKQLKAAAFHRDCDMSELVRQALDQFFA